MSSKKSILVIAIVIALFNFNCFSQQDTVKSKFWEGVKWSVDILPFARHLSFQDEYGTLNPQNRIASLNDYDAGLYLRPNFKLKKSKFLIIANPRINTLVQNNNETDVEFYFQELKLKWYVNNALYVSGGRYIKSIGTSIFINPSNPYFIENNGVNPKFELRPIDFVELNWTTKKSLGVTFIANLFEGEALNFGFPNFDFYRNYGIQLEYFGNSGTYGLCFNLTENENYHLGFNAQRNVNEAVLVWVDGALKYNINRYYPVAGHSTNLLSYESIDGPLNDQTFFLGLVGASYTFKFGPTIYLEYFFNGAGFDNATYDIYKDLVVDASKYNFEITRDLANLNLARSINTGMPFIRRNYLFGQLGENDILNGHLNYNLRYFYCPDDNSGQFSTLIEFNALNNLEIFNLSMLNIGTNDSSFKRILYSQFMFGAIYRF